MQGNYQKSTAAKYVQIYEKVSILEMLDHKQFESLMEFLSQNVEPIF